MGFAKSVPKMCKNVATCSLNWLLTTYLCKDWPVKLGILTFLRFNEKNSCDSSPKEVLSKEVCMYYYLTF